MFKLQRLSCAALACFICLSLCAVPCFATDQYPYWTIDDLGLDLEADFEALESANAVDNTTDTYTGQGSIVEPDTMGISPLSIGLDEQYVITVSSGFRYGVRSSSVSYFPFTQLNDNLASNLVVLNSYSATTGTAYVSSSAGSYVQFDFPVNDAGSISVDGTFTHYLSTRVQARATIYPQTAVLMVNGSEVLRTESACVNGVYTLDNFEYDGDGENITSAGIRFKYGIQSSYNSEYSQVGGTLYFQAYGVDGLTVRGASASDGFLKSIIQWLQNILSAIVNLPSNIASFIIEGVKGLFVPTQAQMQGIFDQYQALLEERLGFIYQSVSVVVDMVTDVKDKFLSPSEYAFQFPGISLPINGETYVIAPAQSVDMDNAVMSIVRPVAGTIVTIICALAFVSSAFSMVAALLGGTSYFDYMKSNKGNGGDEG